MCALEREKYIIERERILKHVCVFVKLIDIMLSYLSVSAPSDSEKHQCYVTVTAVPPVGPCDDCNQLAILHAQHGNVLSVLLCFILFVPVLCVVLVMCIIVTTFSC